MSLANVNANTAVEAYVARCYPDDMVEASPLDRITIELGKRSGQPCIRGLRITVADVLKWLAGGMSEDEILDDYPELEREDFRAVYAHAARMEQFFQF